MDIHRPTPRKFQRRRTQKLPERSHDEEIEVKIPKLVQHSRRVDRARLEHGDPHLLSSFLDRWGSRVEPPTSGPIGLGDHEENPIRLRKAL